MQDSLISAIVPSRFATDAVEERAIENCIYRRDFNAALDRVIALSQKYAVEKRLEQAIPLLQPLKCETNVPSLDAALASAADRGSEAQKLRSFLNDVSGLASSLPPSLAPRVDQRRMERAMAVKWAAQLLSSVKQEKLSHVVASLPEVVSRLSADTCSLESGAVIELITFLLRHDYLRALTLGAQLAALFVTKPEAWPGFIPAVHSLLFPTLWDLPIAVNPPSVIPSAFSSYASLHRQLVAQQLATTQKLMADLWTRGNGLAHIPADSPLLSAAVARMALHSLLRANQLERCFALANEQLAASAALPSHPIYVNFLLDFFFPHFSRIVSAVNNPAQCGPLISSLVYFVSKFPAITNVATLDEELHRQVRRCAAAARERLKDLSSEDRKSASAALKADLGSSFDVEKVREPHKRTLINLTKALADFSAGRMPTSQSRKRLQVQGIDQSMRGAVGLEPSPEPLRKSSNATLSRSISATKVAENISTSLSVSRTPSSGSEIKKEASGGLRVGGKGSRIEREKGTSSTPSAAATSDSDERSDRSSSKKDRKADDRSVRDKKEKSDKASVKKEKHESGSDSSLREKKEKKDKKSSKDDEGSERSSREKSHKKTDEGSERKEKKEKKEDKSDEASVKKDKK